MLPWKNTLGETLSNYLLAGRFTPENKLWPVPTAGTCHSEETASEHVTW